MKNKKLVVFLIVLLSIISVLLIFFMINLMNGKIRFNRFSFGSSVSTELVLDEVYQNDFEKIEVISEAGDIYVKQADSSDVRVVVYGDKEYTKVDVNNKLSVESNMKKCSGICFNRKISKVEIYLPKDYSNSIKVVNNYGDIVVEEFINASIVIEEDCGNIDIVGADEVQVNNNLGDISIGKVNKASIEQSAGDVVIEDVNDVVVENNLGDIEIKNVSNYLKLLADCGDIEVDNINLKKDSIIENNLGKVKIGSTNEIKIIADTDLGDVKINENYKKSNITLEIKNDCGDIVVNN